MFPYKWYLKDLPNLYNNGEVFSCFSGGGGSSMGYKLAGFNVIGCLEIDPRVLDVYKENINSRHCFCEGIQTFKNRNNLPKELYNLTILDGSPPCSSFTNTGKREKDWGKLKKFREGQTEQILDTLFFDFIDLAKKLQPKIVISENVPGITYGNAIKYVQKILKAFDIAGYCVNYWLLDASTMGVPQKRRRVFFIALRKDLSPIFTKKTGLFNQLPALDLNFTEPKIKLKEIITNVNEGPTLTKHVGNQWERAKIGEYVTAFKAGGIKLNLNAVCPVIPSGGQCHYHPHEKRMLNKNEITLIHSFPLDYNFIMDSNCQYITAMSVPPVMMAQIATRILDQWMKKIKYKEERHSNI
jgi:DNA (cytosine-5)-methyltransferase 1